MFGISEIAILIIVCILIFGAKKLPELARSAGKSARILKAEAQALKKEDSGPAGAARADDGRQVVEGTVVSRDETGGPSGHAAEQARHRP
ncbi:Sec-independent protein translocase subunit TatA [Streptomyces sp. Da 82-17]|uniref:Sec-independent protein translocase subunit TatA n=1 Tax=Streptomyces sp. Da 82-17 TaxID=3377116 RepID=UPI0038D509E4